MTINSWNTVDLTGDGQLLIGQTGSRPAVGGLVGCGLTVTEASNSITLDTISTGDDFDLITTSTASASSSIDFTGLSSTYRCYVVQITDFAPATDDTIMYFRTSTDSGSSYDSGASNYTWNQNGVDNDGTIKNGQSGGATEIEIIGRTNDGIGGATNETHSAIVYIFNPSSASYQRVICIAQYVRSNGSGWYTVQGGQRLSTTAVDAVRFIMSSGNIASGTFKLFGLKA